MSSLIIKSHYLSKSVPFSSLVRNKKGIFESFTTFIKNDEIIGRSGVTAAKRWICTSRVNDHGNYRPHHVAYTYREINQRQKQLYISNKLKDNREFLRRPRRSEFLEWNYDAEIHALCARINEPDMDHQLIKEAFRDPSFSNNDKITEEHSESSEEVLKDNSDLVNIGRTFISKTLQSYLRAVLPHVPEELIEKIHNFLSSVPMLYHVAFHIGLQDLIKSKDYPPSPEVMSNSFCAFIGAHVQSMKGSEPEMDKTRVLIHDLIGIQLSGVDLMEVCNIENPMKVLMTVCANSGMGEPEARLLMSTGPETILANFCVGIYSDKELIGKCTGETVEIAEEMATLDALRRLFKMDQSKFKIPFAKNSTITPKQDKNPGIKDWKDMKNISVL